MTDNPTRNQIQATTCRKTGRSCASAQKMLQALDRALAKTQRLGPESFQTNGTSWLTGCDAGCLAKIDARSDRIRLFCDVNGESDLTALNRFADAILSDAPAPLPAGGPVPSALGEVKLMSRQQPTSTRQKAVRQ